MREWAMRQGWGRPVRQEHAQGIPWWRRAGCWRRIVGTMLSDILMGVPRLVGIDSVRHKM
jgi:hypothetical protein